MAKFSYTMNQNDAILAFKKAFVGQGMGSVAILKDKGTEFVLGAPMMTVKVKFEGGICSTSALKNGHCNGETERALDYEQRVKHEIRDFLAQSGVDHTA